MPEGEEHPDGLAMLEFAEALGVDFDEWQRDVLLESLRRRAGRWAAFSVGLHVPRQNGKNGITEVRELGGPILFGERLVFHTAHLTDTSDEAFRRINELVEANEWLSREIKQVRHGNGRHQVEFRNGARIRFRTRTKGGGRGYAGASLIVFDEDMFLNETQMGSILPIVSAGVDPQIWYVGSAVDQQIHEDGMVASRVRHRALEGEDSRLAYFEWSLDYETPDAVPAAVADDPGAWADANPAMGIRIDEETIANERVELAHRTFCVERLCVGDWFDPELTAGHNPIDVAVWDELKDADSVLCDPVCLVWDVSPSRSASIAAAGYNEEGKPHVEIVAAGPSTKWVAAKLASLVAAHDVAVVACDGYGPAASLVAQVEEETGLRVEAMSSSEHAQACGRLVDLVQDRRLRHLGSTELRSAVIGAQTRPLGDAWAWARRTSSSNISPLVAATLALYQAENMPAADVVIY